MEVQSRAKVGMLHPRYDNYLSCLFHTFKEEGVKGLYRGFTPYMIATLITLTAVPVLAELMLTRSHLYGVSSTMNNDDLYDEVAEGKARIESKRKAAK